MMKLKCEIKKLSQRFHHFYVFKEIDLQLETGQVNLIRGSNGSGKSTFLKIISGGMEPWSGEVLFIFDGQAIEHQDIWKQVSFLGPYQELPEELTLRELINFQNQIGNPFGFELKYQELVELFGIQSALDKPIGIFSTGMKQKAKIILAFGEKRPIWILDEPNSNLDVDSSEKLWNWLLEHKDQHLIIVASNDPTEIQKSICVLDMEKGMN
jgi:ABC-2 type transport system ATP-binding protein